MANNRPERYTNLIHARVPQDGSRTVTDYRFFYDDPRRYGLTQDPSGIGVPTAAEVAALVTPVNYAYPPSGPSADVRRYGWSADNDAATNKAAIDKAILVLQNFAGLRPGGTVLIPSGDFDCDPFTIPQYTHVVGAGPYGTTLNYTPVSGGTFITMGSFTTQLKYGCGLRDIGIILWHKDANAIELDECASFDISNVTIEGTTTSGRSNIGVTIDGGGASSFHGALRNVFCNHVELGFQQKGSLSVTQIHYLNCSVNGDVGSFPNSVGFKFESGHGDGSEILGGNLEECGTGILSASGALSYSVFGTRFEANTKDVVLTAGCRPVSFFGVHTQTPYNVTDSNAVGAFYGCVDVNGSRWRAQGQFTGTLTGMTATVQGNIDWRKENLDVVLYVSAQILGTSNSTGMTLTGLPGGLFPGNSQKVPCTFVQDSGNVIAATAEVQTGGTIVFHAHAVSGGFVRPSSTGFTNVATKGLGAGWTIRYPID